MFNKILFSMLTAYFIVICISYGLIEIIIRELSFRVERRGTLLFKCLSELIRWYVISLSQLESVKTSIEGALRIDIFNRNG